MRRFSLAALAAAAAVVLFVLLRPEGDDGQATTVSTNATTRAAVRTRPQRRGVAVIRIAVRRGRVVGGIERASLERGARAVLVVSADVSDHVHLHGYNRFADVRPGRPARLRFRATIAGRFEAELEDAGLSILLLEVSP